MVNEKNIDINDQSETIKQTPNETNDNMQKIDVLDLPPRKTVHDLKRKRTRLKLSRPFIRFFTVTLVIVTIIMIILYLLWRDGFIFS